MYREFTSAVTDLGGALEILQHPASMAGGERAGGGPRATPPALSASAIREHGIEFDNVRFEYPEVGAAVAAGADDAPAHAPARRSGGGGDGAHVAPARAALDGVSFRVPFGKSVAIVGGSGSGKSTVLRLLAALAPPSSGAVRVGGVDVRDLEPAQLRARVAVVSQEARFFRGTVSYNVGYPLLAARARRAASAMLADAHTDAHAGAGAGASQPGAARGAAKSARRLLADSDGSLSSLMPAEHALVRTAAERAQLADVISALPAGYDTDVGDGGSRLSGGERQRVSLARALARIGSSAAVAPSAAGDAALDGGDGGRDGGDGALVLLCDEPTSALDVLTEARVLDELRAIAPCVCLLLVTHRLASCVQVDEVLVLRDGRIAERGAHAELVQRPGGEYARMWRAQIAEERGDNELDHE